MNRRSKQRQRRRRSLERSSRIETEREEQRTKEAANVERCYLPMEVDKIVQSLTWCSQSWEARGCMVVLRQVGQLFQRPEELRQILTSRSYSGKVERSLEELQQQQDEVKGKWGRSEGQWRTPEEIRLWDVQNLA